MLCMQPLKYLHWSACRFEEQVYMIRNCIKKKKKKKKKKGQRLRGLLATGLANLCSNTAARQLGP